MNNGQEMLNRNYNELIELRHVLQKDSSFFDEASDFEKVDETDTFNKPLVEKTGIDGQAKSVKLGFVTGVILREKFITFEKVLWRALRGNLFMKHAEIEEPIKDPSNSEFVEKNVFIIFYQGERSQVKIKKMCESFNANLYPIPETARERKELLAQVNGRVEDLQKVLDKTKTHRSTVVATLSRHVKAWKERVIKEKAIYHTMNMFNYDIGRKLLIAEGWCPKNSTERIVNAMRQATESSGALVPSVLSVIQTHEEPPTHFKTTKLTNSYHAIVEAYGIAQYREINPTPFTVITFPFLFAVMFGDLGHGLLMTMFAAYLIYNEKKFSNIQLNELIKTCFDGRYVLILMGVFSMYTGLLYNECFSIPLDIFGSNWTWDDAPMNGTSIIKAHRIDTDRTYPFGVDPAWKGSVNTLTYYNSLKMKMSIIFGVTQMSLGIILSLFNGLYFRKAVNIFAEFLPQILFFWSLFGYMTFLIFFKWGNTWTESTPPFILNVMISMFLSPYKLDPENKLFDGQLAVQTVCLIIAVVCVPIMLFVKPYVLKRAHRLKTLRNPVSLVETDEASHDDHEEFDFGEIFVKQIIHTIEFVLGAISNTASYLRLWALSLAHAELSEVFWERVLIQTYSMGGFYIIFIGFGAWAGATVGVLMIMESLSAFLHALRLHWVEFQNKFYHGDGYKFTPFSYKQLLAGDDD